jgi:hypothetical protein
VFKKAGLALGRKMQPYTHDSPTTAARKSGLPACAMPVLLVMSRTSEIPAWRLHQSSLRPKRVVRSSA